MAKTERCGRTYRQRQFWELGYFSSLTAALADSTEILRFMEQRLLERLSSKGIHESLNIKHCSVVHGFEDTISNILSFNRFLILAWLKVDKRGRGKKINVWTTGCTIDREIFIEREYAFFANYSLAVFCKLNK